VRIPAGLCGVVGLKTTVGRVSRAGVYPLSWTLDSVGPLARTVEDAALTYMAMQGPDDADDSTHGVAPADVLAGLRAGVRGLRLVVCESVVFDGARAEVIQAVNDAADVLKSLGAMVERRRVPEIEEAGADADRLLLSPVEACMLTRTIWTGSSTRWTPWCVAHDRRGQMTARPTRGPAPDGRAPPPRAGHLAGRGRLLAPTVPIRRGPWRTWPRWTPISGSPPPIRAIPVWRIS